MAGTDAMTALITKTQRGEAMNRPERAHGAKQTERLQVLERAAEDVGENRRDHHDHVNDVEVGLEVRPGRGVEPESVHLQHHLNTEDDGEDDVHSLEPRVRRRPLLRKRVRLRGEQARRDADGEQNRNLKRGVRDDSKREESPVAPI